MSLVAQMVKNLPAMQETRVQFLGREDPPEKGKLTYSGILALRIPWIARRSNQSILKEINPEYSLEALMLSRNSNTLAT